MFKDEDSKLRDRLLEQENQIIKVEINEERKKYIQYKFLVKIQGDENEDLECLLRQKYVYLSDFIVIFTEIERYKAPKLSELDKKRNIQSKKILEQEFDNSQKNQELLLKNSTQTILDNQHGGKVRKVQENEMTIFILMLDFEKQKNTSQTNSFQKEKLNIYFNIILMNNQITQKIDDIVNFEDSLNLLFISTQRIKYLMYKFELIIDKYYGELILNQQYNYELNLITFFSSNKQYIIPPLNTLNRQKSLALLEDLNNEAQELMKNQQAIKNQESENQKLNLKNLENISQSIGFIGDKQQKNVEENKKDEETDKQKLKKQEQEDVYFFMIDFNQEKTKTDDQSYQKAKLIQDLKDLQIFNLQFNHNYSQEISQNNKQQIREEGIKPFKLKFKNLTQCNKFYLYKFQATLSKENIKRLEKQEYIYQPNLITIITTDFNYCIPKLYNLDKNRGILEEFKSKASIIDRTPRLNLQNYQNSFNTKNENNLQKLLENTFFRVKDVIEELL